MDPKLMNTTNKNGRAFNGNRGAVYVAAFFISMAVFAGITHVILSIAN